MSVLLALGVFIMLIGASVAGVLWLDRVMVARVEREDRARCDACLSGGGVTMLPDAHEDRLCEKHWDRLLRIKTLEWNMDGEQ